MKTDKTLTEADFQASATKAIRYAWAGIIIPLFDFLVFSHVNRARKSQNQETLKTANKAEAGATTWLFITFVIPAVVIGTMVNVFVGFIIASSFAALIYIKRKNVWSRSTIIILIGIIFFFFIEYVITGYIVKKQENGGDANPANNGQQEVMLR